MASAAKEKTGGEVVPLKIAENQLPVELMDVFDGYEGAGKSKAADDNVVPFLSLLQDMSPEVKPRDPKYVQGATAGCVLNKATRQLWTPDPDTSFLKDADNNFLELQPCYFERVVNQWISRNAGGGFQGRHELSGSFEATARSLGAKERQDEQNPQKMKWVLPNGHELIDTRYHFVNIITSDGGADSAVISFSSTGHQTSKNWMMQMNGKNYVAVRPDGTKFDLPSFARKFRVRSVLQSKNNNEWFVLEMVDPGREEGRITDINTLQRGKALLDSVRSGKVRADVEAEAQTRLGGASTSDSENVPF